MEKKGFVGYEYHEAAVKRSMASIYIDGYENFGWKLDRTNQPLDSLKAIDKVTLKFKRDRKIHNKAELTRLQRNFDSCISEIVTLEAEKFKGASIIAYIIGSVGTAFMSGAVFAVTAGNELLSAILAIPAFVGWIIPHSIYKNAVGRETERIAPLIDQKYEEMYFVCEKGHALLEYAD